MAHRIAVIAGDGIGPEVVAQGLRVMRAAADRFGFELDITEYPYGTEHWLATEEILPDAPFAEIQQNDAILLGAIGDPRAPVGLIERGIIGRLRWDLDLYVNLRPIKLLDERFCPLKGKGPAEVDMVIVRENTEDAYVQKPSFENQGTPDEVASQPMSYTRKGTERIIRYAFEMAMTRPRKHLTLIDKANAVRAQDLYTRVFAEVAKEYPEVETAHLYVDAACMRMVESPESIDTAVTTNLFGDIVTDLGAMLQGGMGVAAGGNINPDPGGTSMYEPMGGSAPKYTGQNVINPMAAIGAMAMLLEHSGQPESGKRVMAAIQHVTGTKMKSQAAGKMGFGTTEVGDLVVDAMAG